VAATLTALAGCVGLAGCVAQASADAVDAAVRANLGDDAVRIGAHHGSQASTYTYRAPDGIEFTCETGVAPGPDSGWIPSTHQYISCTYIDAWVQQHWDSLTAGFPADETPPSYRNGAIIVNISSLDQAKALGPAMAAALNALTIPLVSGHKWHAVEYIPTAPGSSSNWPRPQSFFISTSAGPPVNADTLTSVIALFYVDALRNTSFDADPTVTDADLTTWPPWSVGLKDNNGTPIGSIERLPSPYFTVVLSDPPPVYQLYGIFDVCNLIGQHQSPGPGITADGGLADLVNRLGGTYQASSVWPTCTATWTLAGHTWQATGEADPRRNATIGIYPIGTTTVTRDGQILELDPSPSGSTAGAKWTVADLEQLLGATIIVDYRSASATLTLLP